MSEQEVENKKYISPHTVLIIVFLILIMLVWIFPVAKIKGFDRQLNTYALMFDKDWKLKIYVFVFVFHLISLVLSILGDIKICKCFIIPLSIFNLVVSVTTIVNSGFDFTFALIATSAFYIAIIGTALHDIVINK